ncbi:MAG TPA: sulfatase-like hydrolase/transferase, partial [Vicinamibacterales bacterium]|nr:sulfatase-like hydrolase/transferase [Vicinamibacterales bacterium]
MSRAFRFVALIGALAVVASTVWWWSTGPQPSPLWPERALPGGNLLLVTLDTLRADRLTNTTMPRLSALARTSHRFRAAYAHAPLTLPSHASILTGLLPPAHGVRGNGAFRLDESHLTLAERLAGTGYQTGAFLGAFVLDSRFGLAQGFDRYESIDDDRDFAGDFAFAQRRAPAVLAGAARWIRAADPARPWFAWVHLFDAHAPHDAPAAGLGAYDDEVHLVDVQLGEFFDRLTADGRLSRTLVVVTADHGESLGEHGETTHGLFAYDATMRVPLVVSGPGLGRGDHAAPAAHVDLVPTVLDVLGLPQDSTLPGRTLRALTGSAPSRPIYLEAQDGWLTAGAAPVTAVVADGLKFIDLPERELYDLVADPRETHNLYSSEPGRARPLAAALGELLASPGVSSAAPRDPAADQRLRALGYVSGGVGRPSAGFTEADDPKRVLPLYERFLTVLSDGGRDVEALSAIAAERPAFVAARIAAASVLIETGRASEAVQLLAAAAASPTAPVVVVERLGAAYLAAGQPAQAATVLARAVADPQASADAWNGLGVARAQSGRPAEAKAAFAEAARLAPGSARIRLNAAMARLESGDVTGAVADLTRLTAERPDAYDAWRLLATVRHGRGDLAGAADAWQRVVAADRGDFDSLFNLAVTLRDLGRSGEAQAAARRFLAAAPRPQYAREAAELAPLTR